MKTYWVIKKNSREPDNVGYSGITCERAGVEPGKRYATSEAARADIAKLNRVNPVGFYAKEIREGEE